MNVYYLSDYIKTTRSVAHVLGHRQLLKNISRIHVHAYMIQMSKYQ